MQKETSHLDIESPTSVLVEKWQTCWHEKYPQIYALISMRVYRGNYPCVHLTAAWRQTLITWWVAAGGFTAGTVDSRSLKTTTEVLKLEMMLTVSSECQQVTLIHYKAVYGPLYSVTVYNNLHVLHLSASSSNWNSVLISRPQLVAPPHPPSCRVTDPSLSLHLCSSQRFLRGLNKRRWVAALTGTWNIPILYKHYITLF